MGMAKKEILIPFVKSWEGGFVNHPNDKGGPTMRGITIGTFRSYFGNGKSVGDLKRITDAQWAYIFERGYWNRWKADQIESQSIANLLVDWVWGSGTTGIKLAQEALGVTVDGIVGPKTLAAVNGGNESTVFALLWKRRKKHFEDLAKKAGQDVFLKGWLNRLNGIKYDKLLCNTYRTYMWRRQQIAVTWKEGVIKQAWEDVK